ncbi:hypothetical protein SFC65_19275 [Priestia filamentosa]
MKKSKFEKCLNCDHEQNVENNKDVDEMGEYTVCEKCQCSFDVTA